MAEKKKVLFICTGNACRSQMAEGLLRHFAGDRFDVFSAGTHPSHVHPMSVKVMAEWGIDLSGHTSDHVDEYLDKNIDIVVTVCDSAKELCPIFPRHTEQIHRTVPDPFSGWAENDDFLDLYRSVRNLIRDFIMDFLQDH